MISTFNYKRVLLFLLIILLIPTEIWSNIFQSFAKNFNFDDAFNSIPLVFLFKYDFNNLTLVKPQEKILKPFRSEIDFFSKFNDKHNKMLSIQEIRKVDFFGMDKHIYERGEFYIEADIALKKAVEFKLVNRLEKAKKLFLRALNLDPNNADILTELGEFIEVHESNIIFADYLCSKAILSEPTHHKADECKKRTSPIVEKLDQRRLYQIDSKLYQFFEIPENNPSLKQLKKDLYLSHIYHTSSIEGNTLSLAQIKSIIETRIAIGEKSLIEQNEVMGVDLALNYLNSLLHERKDAISMDDILEIHKRILGYVDIPEAGKFRHKQVFIAGHTPPPSDKIPNIMIEFIDWLNSEEVKELHPIELAALAHWKLAFIHPFSDGNGRTARLLMNLILMRANYLPTLIRLEDREQYFKMIKIAAEVDVRPFIRFIADCTERTLDDYLETFKDSFHMLTSTSYNSKNVSLSLVYGI